MYRPGLWYDEEDEDRWWYLNMDYSKSFSNMFGKLPEAIQQGVSGERYAIGSNQYHPIYFVIPLELM